MPAKAAIQPKATERRIHSLTLCITSVNQSIMNERQARKVPDDAPTSFVRERTNAGLTGKKAEQAQEHQEILFPTRLIVRASTAPAPQSIPA